jgi:hypothetical protein
MTDRDTAHGSPPTEGALDLSDAAVWELETRFWQGDEALYDAWLAPRALMFFPDPTGILDRSAILASIRGAPRWTEVRCTDRRLARPSDGVVVVAYRVEARIEAGGEAYRAWASSAYVRSKGAWSLALHQQTPIA